MKNRPNCGKCKHNGSWQCDDCIWQCPTNEDYYEEVKE